MPLHFRKHKRRGQRRLLGGIYGTKNGRKRVVWSLRLRNFCLEKTKSTTNGKFEEKAFHFLSFLAFFSFLAFLSFFFLTFSGLSLASDSTSSSTSSSSSSSSSTSSS